jgi:hypothetical protein
MRKVASVPGQQTLLPVVIVVVEAGAIYLASCITLLTVYLLGSNVQYPVLDGVSPSAEHTVPGSLVESKYLPGTCSELQFQVAGYNTGGCEAYKEVQARPTSYETNRHKKICSLEQHTFGNIETISGMPGPL